MRIAIFAFALSLILCTLADTAGARPEPTTHTVTIEGMKFQPEALAVAVGDIVVWVNKDLVPHTATSSKAGIFDSKLIEAAPTSRMAVSSLFLEVIHNRRFHPNASDEPCLGSFNTSSAQQYPFVLKARSFILNLEPGSRRIAEPRFAAHSCGICLSRAVQLEVHRIVGSVPDCGLQLALDVSASTRRLEEDLDDSARTGPCYWQNRSRSRAEGIGQALRSRVR